MAGLTEAKQVLKEAIITPLQYPQFFTGLSYVCVCMCYEMKYTPIHMHLYCVHVFQVVVNHGKEYCCMAHLVQVNHALPKQFQARQIQYFTVLAVQTYCPAGLEKARSKIYEL